LSMACSCRSHSHSTHRVWTFAPEGPSSGVAGSSSPPTSCSSSASSISVTFSFPFPCVLFFFSPWELPVPALFREGPATASSHVQLHVFFLL
ncbi:hypothetical protein M404DRAFT_1005300, partial [Pisolithus tinctorius Marx 270]